MISNNINETLTKYVGNAVTPLFLLLTLLLSSCNDYLDVNSESQGEVDEKFTTADELRSATAYLYAAPWYLYNTSNIWTLGDVRANNFLGLGTSGDQYETACALTNSSSGVLSNSWRSLYNVITKSDYVIEDYAPKALANGVDTTDVYACEGEARFMRGLAYWFLAINWHDVPIIENPDSYADNPYANAVMFQDVIDYALRDMQFAAQWLPKTDTKGRVTKCSAEGMLGRLYLTAADFARGGLYDETGLARNGSSSNEALAEKFYAASKVASKYAIDNANAAGYGLMDDFEDLYKVKNNNNKETLFGLQWVEGSDTYGLGNVTQSSFAYNRYLVGDLSAWGLGCRASYDFVHQLLTYGGLSRLRGSIFADKQVYNYLGAAYSGYWKVGYEDSKGDSTGTYYNQIECPIKKFVVGGPKDTENKAIDGNSSLVTPMLRLSEVYLNYVDACIGSGNSTSNPAALALMEKVRRRAWKMELEGTSPLIYPYDDVKSITKDDLFIEYRMETFMEGLFWSMITRRSFYDMGWTLKYLNNTLRLDSGKEETMLTNYRWWGYDYDYNANSIGTISLDNSANEGAKGAAEMVSGITDGKVDHTAANTVWTLPYPQQETSQDPLLLKDPIHFTFK